MTGSRRLWLPLLLIACLGGCYVPSAGRRSAQILERGWDPDERGVLMILTGPVSVVHASADFAVHALVPLDYDGYFLVDRREPSNGVQLERDLVVSHPLTIGHRTR